MREGVSYRDAPHLIKSLFFILSIPEINFEIIKRGEKMICLNLLKFLSISAFVPPSIASGDNLKMIGQRIKFYCHCVDRAP